MIQTIDFPVGKSARNSASYLLSGSLFAGSLLAGSLLDALLLTGAPNHPTNVQALGFHKQGGGR